MMKGKARAGGTWRSGSATDIPEAFPPPAPSAKQESMDYYTQGKMGEDGLSQDEDVRKRPWEKNGGVKPKRKKVPGLKNLRIRRYVQPKNAVMCLNELRPGVVYTTEQEGGVGQPFCISVEVEGQKYRGLGSSKQLAKQASAEAALISFVKPPVVSSGAAGEGTTPTEEDKTPWATLASFAIYKLFNDWREGRIGLSPPPAQSYGAILPPGFQGFLSQSLGSGVAFKTDASQTAAFTEAIAAHLGGGRSPVTTAGDTKVENADGTKVPKPAKQVPDNAAAMHPVMVLHQMKPALQYNINQVTRDNKPHFSVQADIDGKIFTGEGPNVKKAKFALALEAVRKLYDIVSTFEVTS